MSLANAYLALGSNIGNRLEHLRSAVSLLAAEGAKTVAGSPVYENRAVGMGDADPFLNAVIEVQTAAGPQALLEVCLAVEKQLGRVRTRRWAPRTIDIDLLIYANLRVNTDTLQLPHPRITERDFVLQPLADIAPGLELAGKPIEEWLRRLPAVELTKVAFLNKGDVSGLRSD